MKQVEYIIAGAGASGLTLAYLLSANKDIKKSILLIDRDDKTTNDRTWCFWEKEDNLFEHLVHKTWPNVVFKGTGFSETFDVSPYQYKLIRGIDFYAFMKKTLLADDRVTWIKDEIKHINADGIVETSSETYQGEYVFDSTFDHATLKNSKSTTLLQHFKGYVIETQTKAFDPNSATYMDFTIAQEGDCRFGYILPFSENKALVEYTLFNQELLEDAIYTDRLERYIEGLGIQEYEIIEEEYGVIPMTDYDFKIKESDRVINIGIKGGFAKPSTGYTFLRGQHILQQMVKNLSTGKDPLVDLPYQQSKFKKYDATLLSVLASKKFTGDQIFTGMFQKAGAKKFFKFLDEQTSLKEDIKIMATAPLLDFGGAFLKSLMK
ncbi:lycopene cyclase family protein [Roseivirga misakiensis]|uniref:Lycopene cyclase n=1 Tax=Roseivirga misakiensis TaxID=1563681 RepID=A0A1E5T1N3_9BACT|nr:lycopene cyclase family protein [Roseivirga misakiensis]OEK05280.1 hypothetical protein BFP71_17930 [Roseivirga misakiensis]